MPPDRRRSLSALRVSGCSGMVVPAHVEHLDGWQRPAIDALAQPQPGRVRHRLRAGRRAAEQQHRPVIAGALCRHGPGVVPRIALVLVRGLVLLVDDDQADVGNRREHRRARPDAHPRLAANEPLPFRRALRAGDPRVHDGDDVAEPRLEPLERLRRQRDLRHEHDCAASCGERVGDRVQVHLGLAGAGHAVQQQTRAGAVVQGAQDGVDRDDLLRREWGRRDVGAADGMSPQAGARAGAPRS